MATPQFEASEIFTCIEMEKDSIFILVEGHEADVYDNALRGRLGKKSAASPGWLVVSGSDKDKILEFRRKSNAKNFFAILDRDFEVLPEQMDRVTYLDRYSIENYLMDEMVVRQTAARLYKKASTSVAINLDRLISHYHDSLGELLGYLLAYQGSNEEKHIKWSEQRILKKDCWMVCEESTRSVIDRIKSDHVGIRPIEIDEREKFLRVFPGKIISKGIYYYLKKQINPPKFTSTFNNELAFFHSLLANIEYSEDFVRCLDEPSHFLVQYLTTRSRDAALESNHAISNVESMS